MDTLVRLRTRIFFFVHPSARGAHFPADPVEVKTDDITRLTIPRHAREVATYRRTDAIVVLDHREVLLTSLNYEHKRYRCGKLTQALRESNALTRVAAPKKYRRALYLWKA